jgi:hypothetical protein
MAENYIQYASGYQKDNINETDVADIYQGKTLTKAMVLTINKDIDHWEQLKEDLAEINYPNNIL